jgi:hypothetical protein
MLVPALSPTAWAVVVAVLLLVAVVTVVCVVRARRLDRLHRRTDAARAGLADALDRRGAVALQVADALAGPPGAAGSGPPVLADVPGLRAAAHDALDACRTALRRDRSDVDAAAPYSVRGGRPAPDQAGLDPCEVAENTLTRRLAGVERGRLPAGLAAELADAEQSVLIARRVHNDAVRDTLDLRSRRLVRWLRLAGTAPEPVYFEIADPPSWQPAGPAPAVPAPAGTGTDAAG